MKFPVLWSGLCCYTEGWGGKCSEILATIKLLYNARLNKVFIHSLTQAPPRPDFIAAIWGTRPPFSPELTKDLTQQSDGKQA